jgi:hypothetical protein
MIRIHSCGITLFQVTDFVNLSITWMKKKCIGNLGNYLTRSNQPREEYGGEGSKVLAGKSGGGHHHLYLPVKRTMSIQTEVFLYFFLFVYKKYRIYFFPSFSLPFANNR